MTNKSKLNTAFNLPENIHTLDKTGLDTIIYDVIDRLDFKSKKQMQILNSIPFSSTNFRRDFKEKFVSLKFLEDEKILLRNDLQTITNIYIAKKYSGNFRFKHYLSDKEIDVDSNRQLKNLIREYKRLKN